MSLSFHCGTSPFCVRPPRTEGTSAPYSVRPGNLLFRSRDTCRRPCENTFKKVKVTMALRHWRPARLVQTCRKLGPFFGVRR